MVAALDVVVCFLAALAHKILVCSLQLALWWWWWQLYLCGGTVAGYSGWIVVSKCTSGCCSAPAEWQMPTNWCQNVIVHNITSIL